MYLRETVNVYGMPVSEFKCDTCGDVFTVCPPVPPEVRDQWDGCLSEDCGSYEPMRDAELYLSLGMVEPSGGDGDE